MALSVAARAEKLRVLLNYHNYRYHTLDAPELNDEEFDALTKELQALESAHPELITADSPTQRVGSARLSAFKTVRHPAPLLSLDNAFSADDLREWYERVTRRFSAGANIKLAAEPKIDGLSVALHYESGRLALGATRGDGYEGEDVTANLRTLKSIPLSIPLKAPQGRARLGAPVPDLLVVRGEVYFPKDKFAELNRQLEANAQRTYANPRNTAAGSVRQL